MFRLRIMRGMRQMMWPAKEIISNIKPLSTEPSSLVELTMDNDGICTLTMQRPPVNSLNLDLLQDLITSLDEAAKNKIKGIVLTSAFPKVFSAGVDLNEVYEPQIERLKTHWTVFQDVWIKLFGSDFISTAAINGHSPAGGCVLALACEYRAMVQDKTIGLNETIIGFVPPKWVIEPMRLAVSSREAELALTSSKMYLTEEALKVGLIDDQAIDKEEAIQKCKLFIKKFDKIPSFARIETKKEIRGPILKILAENRKEDIELCIKNVLDDKFQNAVRRYLVDLKSKRR